MADSPARPQPAVLAGAGLAALALGLVLWTREPRMAMLFVIGGLLGLTLYHAAFGFASAYRRLLAAGDGAAVMPQLLMLALGTLLFAPVLAGGEAFGQGVAGAVAPVALQVAAGAFLFGIGMQISGGCGSGTLYTVGGGSTRMVATLLMFCAGSFWASLHMGWWQGLPSAGAVALGAWFGWPLAVAAQLALLVAIGWALVRFADGWPAPVRFGGRNLWAGPWPPAVAAALLALFNLATLLLAGHPWSITWAFTLWGAKTAALLGWDPSGSGFWVGGFQQHALETSLLGDVTSMMNVGIVLGALAAAALAGRFAPQRRISWRPLFGALLGGALMGYGARIAFGCNIGAFFSGIASTSLHGWLWIAAAIPGCWVGVRLRPRFGLENPTPARP